MRNAETVLGITGRLLESRMKRKFPVRFGGGRSEKELWHETISYLAGRLPNVRRGSGIVIPVADGTNSEDVRGSTD